MGRVSVISCFSLEWGPKGEREVGKGGREREQGRER